jgi:hypothetical protein
MDIARRSPTLQSQVSWRQSDLFVKHSASDLVRQILANCRELTRLTGIPFSPDGHLVGALGDVFAPEKLGLQLTKPSNCGYHALQ